MAEIKTQTLTDDFGKIVGVLVDIHGTDGIRRASVSTEGLITATRIDESGNLKGQELVQPKCWTEKKPREVKRFLPPTVEEVQRYCYERGNRVDAAAFVNFYAAKGWKIGKDPMKDWKAAVRTWEQRERGAQKAAQKQGHSSIDNEEVERMAIKKYARR